MSLRRLAAIVLSAVAALLLAIALYVAFGGLSRHKGRIEALVTQQIGRPFAIDGAFEVELLPSISVLAERVRVGNAQWGSQPQMIELGRFSTKIGLWSLISGPVDVRSLELSDVSVVLEKGPDGQGNWVLGDPGAAGKESDSPAAELAEVPAVVLHAELRNVRLVYREGKMPERVALLETFTIAPGSAGLLAIAGNGSLNDFAVAVKGDLGPLDALVSGRDIRVAIQAAVGDLRLDVNGGVGSLNPLRGADLAVKVGHPDVGAMLKKLELPAIATGALIADAQLKDAGDLTRLDFAAKLGGIAVKASGTLRTLGLPGSDLRFDASVADVARVAAAFDVAGLPAGALELGGRLASSRTEITLDALSARFAGAKARVDGTIGLGRAQRAEMRFELAAESLARLREGLPKIPLSMKGSYAGSRDKIEVKDLKGRIGESEITARASIAGTRKKRVELKLASPLLDLTPFSADKAGAGAKPKPPPKQPPAKFVFDEAPLPLDKLKDADAKLRFTSAEVRFGAGAFRDVEATLLLDGGRLALDGRARGGLEGTIGGAVRLTPARAGAAELDLKLTAKNLRAGLGAGGVINPGEEPPMSAEASLLASGASARQMASGANGRILVTQGPGKLKGAVIGMVGGDLLGELAGKLNPFAAQDAYTKLECTVAWADIVDGRVTVRPVLMQSEKVTIVSAGEIDLGTEALKVSFNTRPRTGIGVTAGMFANPFIELAGTLASPRLGVAAKGATAAAATGGVSVLLQGLLDRVRGNQDQCKTTLDEVAAKTR
jgi:uncharacterized protein involved in outer membrane biogenesis